MYMTKEEEKIYKRQWYLAHKEEVKARSKKYFAEHKEEQLAKRKQRYEENKEAVLVKQKEYRDTHKEEIVERNKKYYYTKRGRAKNLIRKYIEYDKVHEKGICTLTEDWIIENIFTSSCVYCGDDNWEHLGCDRIDNSLPHTPDNVVCSCGICNAERSDLSTVEDFKQYRKYHPRFIDIKRNRVGLS